MQELKDLDQAMKGEGEDNSDNEDEFSEIQADLSIEFEKVKRWNTEHREVGFQLEKMYNFMLESEVNIGEVESTNKQEARKIMALSEKLKETDLTVLKWKKENAKWLKKRKM